jgi:hypothetical protein
VGPRRRGRSNISVTLRTNDGLIPSRPQCGEDGSRPRFSAGGQCARYFLGTGHADAGPGRNHRISVFKERRCPFSCAGQPGALVIHAAHSTHAAHPATRWHTWRTLGLRPVAHHRLGGDQQPRDRGGVLQRYPHDLGRIDNPGRHHVLVVARLCVIAEILVILIGQFTDDDRPVGAGILCDLPDRRLDGLANDLDADLLVVVCGFEGCQDLARKKQRNATAGYDTFLDRGLGRVTVAFEDGALSFVLSKGATFEDLADRLDRLGERHYGKPVANRGQTRRHVRCTATRGPRPTR